jgi:hypothetical protein
MKMEQINFFLLENDESISLILHQVQFNYVDNKIHSSISSCFSNDNNPLISFENPLSIQSSSIGYQILFS